MCEYVALVPGGHCGFQPGLASRFPTGALNLDDAAPLELVRRSHCTSTIPSISRQQDAPHKPDSIRRAFNPQPSNYLPDTSRRYLARVESASSHATLLRTHSALPLAQRRACISRPSTPRLIDGSIPQTATVVSGTSPPALPCSPSHSACGRQGSNAPLPHPAPSHSRLCSPSRHRVLCPLSLRFLQTGCGVVPLGFCDPASGGSADYVSG